MGLIRGVARTAVIAGTATAVSNRVSRRQAGRWANQEQEQAAQQQQAAQAAAQQQAAQQQASQQQSGGMDAKIEQLKQLADLKAQGVLTDAEFEAQKSRLLGS
ncbi:hypothetical protein Rhe02_22780 [Rhizocola hellebori]|uniref:SHOCT domain-containing protein n=1 Tax=Rhizocola hellebori TaxID=1392758 RepID=A0A8J3VFH9_9ACTN|nr:SHOCT domain-containing protein [Rhizocola hellebori]GIH04211.1 hypothetical protein Rhe02_22780 [Rhizocola hellebori]